MLRGHPTAIDSPSTSKCTGWYLLTLTQTGFPTERGMALSTEEDSI
jgi:hypothetical protein